MTQEAQLKACPFCGSDMDSFAGITDAAFAQGSDGTRSIQCDCGALGPFMGSLEEAIAAWNTRIESGVVAELVTLAKRISSGQRDLAILRGEARKILAKLDASK